MEDQDQRDRHIHIRQFWLSEKVTEEVELQHLGTEDTFENILKKRLCKERNLIVRNSGCPNGRSRQNRPKTEGVLDIPGSGV